MEGRAKCIKRFFLLGTGQEYCYVQCLRVLLPHFRWAVLSAHQVRHRQAAGGWWAESPSSARARAARPPPPCASEERAGGRVGAS
eukprot:4979319-Pyramimonas_sp.AAC.1